MLERFSLNTFTNTITNTLENLWGVKNYLTVDNPVRENHELYHSVNYKKLIMMGAMSLLANKDQLGLGIGLAATALFAEPVGAALPFVANPIPTQYAQPGQAFSYGIDLNQVFSDADGDVMTFGGVTMADGSPLPNWLTAGPVRLWGRDDYANEAFAVEGVGDLAYVANGNSGLLIFNISNPNQKVFVSSFDTPGYAYDVTVQNGIAYVASAGLHLINVSDPAVPTLLSSVATMGGARSLAVQNSVAYVAVADAGLQFINVSNPQMPELLGSFDTSGDANGVVVQNGIAYVTDWYSGLQLINVSNASATSLLGTYATPGVAVGVVVQNGVAYVAVGGWGLWLINVSNASNPTLLASFDAPAADVIVQNGVAYLTGGRDGLQLINVSNVSNPMLLSSVELAGGDAQGVTVQNGVAYVADSGLGLQLINVSNSSHPILLGSIVMPSAAEGITVQNETAYAADSGAGLLLINVSNGKTPKLLGRVANLPYATALCVTVQNEVAYVGDSGYGLRFINITNLSNPIELPNYNLPGVAVDIVMQNGVVYVANGGSGLQLVNVSDINNPMLLGSYDTPGNTISVTVHNEVAYITDWYGGGLRLINVSNPNNLTLLSSILTSGNFPHVTIQNEVAYVAEGLFVGLSFLNVSNVSNPILLGSIDTAGDANDITVQNGAAYVANGYSGLQIINVSNISNPTLLGNIDTPGYAHGIVVENGTAYVADYGTGLQIIGLGHTRFTGILPLTANGSYYFTVHATNNNSEWVSANFQLRIGIFPPTLINNFLSLSIGQAMTLGSQNLNATDDLTPVPNLEFIVSQVSHGYFQTSNNPTVLIYSFTQQQIQNGNIQFVHDGSNNPPSYQVYVNDGSLNSLPQWAAVTFNGNAAPILVNNQITINTGQTIILTSANLQVTDADNPNIDNSIFTVTNVQYGFFANSANPSVSVTSFSQGDINAGNIQFTHDGSTNYPSYFVSVSDGTFTTPPSLVQINFNNNAVPIVLSNQLTISAGQSITIGIANIGGLDLNSNSNNLIFTINNLSGGQFELANNPGVGITQFTQQDILNGNVNFVADDVVCEDTTPPSYSLQASDGTYSSILNVASIDYTTDTTTNGCVVTTSAEQDNTNVYIGVGVGVAAFATAATVLGIFAVKRKHLLEREAERIDEMDEMAQHAAKYKNQPQTPTTELPLEEMNEVNNDSNHFSY